MEGLELVFVSRWFVKVLVGSGLREASPIAFCTVKTRQRCSQCKVAQVPYLLRLATMQSHFLLSRARSNPGFEIFENSLSQKLKLCIWVGSKSRVQPILVVREVRFVARRVRFLWCAKSVLSARGIVVLCLRGSDDHICLLEATIIFARGERTKRRPEGRLACK